LEPSTGPAGRDAAIIAGVWRPGTLLALAAGCGEPAKEVAPIVGDRAPCGFVEDAAGTVDVSEQADRFHGAPFSRVEGRFLEAPYPSFHAVALEEGACRHYELAIGDCDPACEGGLVCTADGACAAFPGGASAGRLTVDGLAEPVSIEASGPAAGDYRSPAGLPFPLFEASDPVSAQVSGGQVPRIRLAAAGVAPMDADLVSTGLVLADGGDALVTWTAGPDPEACVQVVLNGSNLSHGAPLRDIVRCEGADTGSLTIPQAIVERFPHGDTPEVTEGYDHPASTLGRYTRSRVETDSGPVELLVRSTTYFLVSHPEP
jgi:hypothetical protein